MKYLQYFPVFKLTKDIEEKKMNEGVANEESDSKIKKVNIKIKPEFQWSSLWNRNEEKFWAIVYNEKEIIYRSELCITEENIKEEISINIEISIGIEISDKNSESQCMLMILSNSWFGAKQLLKIN